MSGMRMYVTLDSLLDTRLGAMNLLNSTFAKEVTKHPKYFTREIDIFHHPKYGTLSNDKLNKFMAKYKDVVLRNSMQTKMSVFLDKLIDNFIYSSTSSPTPFEMTLDVNVYPFQLYEKDIEELKLVISDLIDRKLTVNIINKSIEELSIELVSESYRYMVMYEYHDWLNHHTEALKKQPLRLTVIYVPRIYFGHLPTQEELKEAIKLKQSPFDISSRILSYLMNIEYIPIAFYCVNSQYNKDEYLG